MIIPSLLSKKKPLFKEKIYVTRPTLPAFTELSPMIKRMLKKRWVTNFGDFHNELEQKIRDTLGVKYVVLCCNGTIALFLLLKALGLKGKVLTTPFTFPATIHSIYMAGLEPLFCDINLDDYTLDPICVEKNISPSVSLILGVNVYANVCAIEKLEDIGNKAGIPVIYDSAHAFMTKYNKKYVGGFGKAEMFSFHATKLFTTLEGGAITTNEEWLFKKLKLLINFGIKGEENVIDIGLNAKMSEMNAIFGLLVLKKIDKILEKLSNLLQTYKERLAKVPGIKFQKVRNGCNPNNQYMPVEIIAEDFGLDRNQLHKVLKEDNIITRKYFYPPAHQYGCYKDMDFAKNIILPNTEKVANRILCLPIYSSLKVSDVEKICDLIKSTHCHSKEIHTKLKEKLWI